MMAQLLLSELSSSDIDWMIATGKQQEVTPGSIIIEPGKTIDKLYILLDGSLTMTVSQSPGEGNLLAGAFALLEGNEVSGREVAKLSSGEIAGEEFLLETRPPITTIRAIEKSLLLSISHQQLSTKLTEDIEFAAHFYRIVAIMLSDRLQDISNQLGHGKISQSQSLKEVLFVFGEFSDSDLDWIIAMGRTEEIPAGRTLIQEGKPVDALYIILNGKMKVSVAEGDSNPLTLAFATLGLRETTQREVARVSKGEIVGETAVVGSGTAPNTIQALDNSLVLSIPRQQLKVKLEQDVRFAARFYRAIAALLSDRLRSLITRIGYGRRTYSTGQLLDEDIEYEDELDISVMDQMSLAGSRFKWMLSRIRTS
ncbi:cyclic nucleotide-binding domain-containing protein [Coleofasciculus chthonoplastes]|uniref:cyclic nucleotide-binding domain-containing protein n=1 Tax=Coleofasciculus chthonoplastes TaxID=64178 RepID=UPI0032FF4B0D